MREIVTGILMIAGSAFMLIASLGVFRMPDFLSRMHCSTKAGSLGVGCIMLSAATHYSELEISVRAVIAILFILLTAPVGAHVIGRAAYFLGTPLWEGTFVDELRRDREKAERESRNSD